MKSRALALGLAAGLLATTAVAQLGVRKATFSWGGEKKDMLRGTFEFKDALDNATMKAKISKGTTVTVLMRGYVIPNGGGDPIVLTAHTCTFVYDLWNEVYKVSVDGGSAKSKINMIGVHRACTELVDHPIAERFRLKNGPSAYYLAVKVEVNPTDEKKIAQIKAWVTRPAGATGGISLGDALFSTFVGLFMKNIPTADWTVDFRTAAFPP
ncbi:MAG: hypothetical protein IPJ34_40175 [Myxococcales bacterium]|nr:hypothetical protein [Myxococcales bacterium]